MNSNVTQASGLPTVQSVADAAAARRARNALWIATIGAGVMAVTALFFIYMAFRVGGWQLSALAASAAVLLCAPLVSVVLVRRGRVEVGMWLLLCAAETLFVVGSSLVAGLGLVLPLATSLTASVVSQTLPPKAAKGRGTSQGVWAMGIGVVASVVVLLVDVFELPFRAATPAPMLVFVPIMCACIALAYGYSAYRQFGSYTQRTKLITAFLLVTLIPLALLATLNNRNSRTAYTANIGSSMKALANTQALVIGDELDRQVTELGSLSQNQELRNAAEASTAAMTGTLESIQAEIDRLDQQWRAADAGNNDDDPLVYSRLYNPVADRLRDFRTILPDNVEVFITDKYGALVAATNRTSDYNQADEEWWQASYNNGQGATYVGPLEYDESSKTYASNLAVPMYGADNKTIAGILRTTLRLKTLLDTLNIVRLGQTGRMELFIPGGQKLAEAGEKPVQVDEGTVAQIEAAAQSDYVEMTYDGIPSLVSQAPVTTTDPERAVAIAGLGWLVAVHQDQAEGLAPLKAQFRGTTLLLLGIAAVVSGAALGAAQLLSGPITRLTATARQVTAGDVSARARVEAQDEIGTLATSFNAMVAQLQQTLAELEQRVAERTREVERRSAYLEASAEVSRAATSILDPEQLTGEMVERIRERFELYYVGLFLVDERGEWAVLRAGTGSAGRALLGRGHRLAVGAGMVGWTIAHAEARIASSAEADAVRLATPELPETRSEAALPLRSARMGGKVLGALTVQDTRPDAFDQEGIVVLQTMADQIAVALDNARLFAESQQAIEAERRAYGEVSREAWRRMIQTRANLGYRCDERGVVPTPGSLAAQGSGTSQLPEGVWQAVKQGKVVLGPHAAAAQGSGTLAAQGSGTMIAVPIPVRGQVVGALNFRRAGQEDTWTDEEIAMLNAMADQLGQALDNARLFEDTQRRAARDRMLGQVTTRMRETLDIDAVLQTAIREIGEAMGIAEVEVRMSRPPRQATGEDRSARNGTVSGEEVSR